MRFLCLAYGSEGDWLLLPEEKRNELLAQDDVLRRRGARIAVVGPPTVVTAWDGPTLTRPESYGQSPAPLVGFSLLDADSPEEAVALVAGTPCAVAGGAIEVRPVIDPPAD